MNKDGQIDELLKWISAKDTYGHLYILNADIADPDVESLCKASNVGYMRAEICDMNKTENPIAFAMASIRRHLDPTGRWNVDGRLKYEGLALYEFTMNVLKGLSDIGSHTIVHLVENVCTLNDQNLVMLSEAVEHSKSINVCVLVRYGKHHKDMRNTDCLKIKDIAEMQNDKSFKVYISYKHEDAGSAIGSIVAGLENNGIEYSIDKNDLPYRESISAYEKEIGDSQHVIMVITQGYLESTHCMFEMANIVQNGKLNSRVFPLVKIEYSRDNDGLQKLRELWETRRTTEMKHMRHPGSDGCVLDELKKIDMIIANLDGFWSYIKDTNTCDFDDLVADDAKLLIQCLKKEYDNSTIASQDLEPVKVNNDVVPTRNITQYGPKSVVTGNIYGTLNIQ
jgi:hypothetical protein